MEDKLFFLQKIMLPDVAEGILLLLKIKLKKPNNNKPTQKTDDNY